MILADNKKGSYEPFSFCRKLLYCSLLLSVFSCTKSEQQQVLRGNAQGTTYLVKFFHPEDLDVQEDITTLLQDIDKSLSTYRSNSLISRFNRGEQPIQVDSHFVRVHQLSQQIFKLSKGAFDPTIAPVVNYWGFGFKNRDKVQPETLEQLLPLVGYQFISIDDSGYLTSSKEDVQLDYNAVAQGYTVDAMAELLEKKGIRNYFVELGGEVRVKGNRENGQQWRVGIDKPISDLDVDRLHSIVRLNEGAVVTSGNYRKFYVDPETGQKYSHTINPLTGIPVSHNLLSATVYAESAGIADALATGLMVVGLEQASSLISNNGIGALLIYTTENDSLKSTIVGTFPEVEFLSSND